MTRRKDGRWQQSVKLSGMDKPKVFYGKTKNEVLEKINAWREELKRGRLFEAVADEWWEKHIQTLSPTTVRSYKAAYEYAAKHFKAVPIAKIKPSSVSAYINKAIAEKRLGRSAAANHMLVINLIFSYAVVTGEIDVNPAREVFLPRSLKSGGREMPSNQDLAIVKENIQEPFGLFAYWILYTGCRKGELSALRWEDVDMEDGVIHITKSCVYVNGRPQIKEPKTKNGIRDIPILKRLSDVFPDKPQKGYIFPSPNGGMLTETQFRKRWDRYAAKTGINCTCHALRHAYATMLYEAGIQVLDAQRLLGHAYASTTQDIYTHIRKSRNEEIKKQLYNIDIK